MCFYELGAVLRFEISCGFVGQQAIKKESYNLSSAYLMLYLQGDKLLL